MIQSGFQPKPDWLKIRRQAGDKQGKVMNLLQRLSLNTVCAEANCPNLMECFGKGTAAFMILGKHCTRNCTFCCVEKDNPQTVDGEEPVHVARAVHELGVKHVVVTSVTRDDLPDGGAGQFALTVKEIRKQNEGVTIEVLIPDFLGSSDALSVVVKAGPDIINHNMETVPRLYPEVRPMAMYTRSLNLLGAVREMTAGIYTKSGIMVGLGETEAEVIGLMEDLRQASCDILTIGQYLAPSKKHHPVAEYVHPDVFKRYKEAAEAMGFLYVASAPLVRSSYQAEKALEGKRVQADAHP